MTLAPLSIIEACADPGFFAPWFKARESWATWFVVLKGLFGLPMSDDDRRIFAEYTGGTTPQPAGYTEAFLICGRRAGKSLILAVIAVFLACFGAWSSYLVPGERATVLIIATDRRQARTIFRYVRGFLTGVPMLAELIERETADTIDLVNGVTIEIGTASFRSLRGYTVIAALCDEMAFWPNFDAAEPDAEIIAALRPAMATVPGSMLLCASSPYARRGVLWDAFRRHYGQNGTTLIWKADTRTMNRTVPQSFIDAEYEKDPASAAAEYGAEFRSDIESFVAREAIESLVVPGRHELPPVSGVTYFAFVDAAGGSGGDSFALSIAHRGPDKRAIVDVVRERRPPFSPAAVCDEFAKVLTEYRVRKVVGDRWGGEFPREKFRAADITYEVSDKAKSDIYKDVLATLNSGNAELLDHPKLIAQLCGLERRTARGGKDSIDHAPGAHDDIANSVAGALLLAVSGREPMQISDAVLRLARIPTGHSRPRGVPAYF